MGFGRDLETILKEGDPPADHDHFEQRDLAIFQVAILGEGHEDVGDGKESNGSHGVRRLPFVAVEIERDDG
jgi:hypothetical protein